MIGANYANGAFSTRPPARSSTNVRSEEMEHEQLSGRRRDHENPVAASDRAAKRARSSVAAALALALASPAPAAGLPGDATHGEQLYQACTDCHSLDQNDVGPRHRGVYGRKAGSLPDYNYSDALKSSGLVWSEDTLGKWLTDPQALVPGTKMYFHFDNPQDRADVIAYLRERAK
jgi:cytochrome c